MPKHTKKSRLRRPNLGKMDVDDSASIDDGVSSCSTVSDLTSICDDTDGGYSTNNELTLSTDSLDEKLDQYIEDLRHKDLKTRENALRNLQNLFTQRFIADQVTQRSDKLMECLMNCLRRGSEIDGKLAASVSCLFIVQLGEPNDELFLKFRDVMVPMMRDESKPSSLRAKYAQAIGIICFLASEDISVTYELMMTLESIFSRSYLLADGTSPVIDQDLSEIHAAALSSWCLLLSTMSNNLTHELIRNYAPEKIPGLIESHDANLRNQAGETIAVLYEIAREIHSIFAEPPESLLTLLDQKAKESVKYKSKKEKRLQHATFREIFNSFEDGTTPDFDVKFGRETLEITSWTSRFYYNVFSHLLGAGVTRHLKENQLLRSIFNLNEPEFVDPEMSRNNRFERQLANKTAFKLRTQEMRKTRASKSLRCQYSD